MNQEDIKILREILDKIDKLENVDTDMEEYKRMLLIELLRLRKYVEGMLEDCKTEQR